MGWDTVYRPRVYDDVVGHDNVKKSLKRVVAEGKGAHHSYLFYGPSGTGKTTVARILARAILCSNPINGEPCDKCSSCVSILERGSSPELTEIDAATRSGKEEIIRIVETSDFHTLSGKPRIYIFDESHALTKGASNALLKPMEEESKNGNKRLVCIFCTTEPDSMIYTIKSRCGKRYSISFNTPEALADRLAYICDKEGVKYDLEALALITERERFHVRSSIHRLEELAGSLNVTKELVYKHLHLDLSQRILDLLLSVFTDVSGMEATLEQLIYQISPSQLYKQCAEILVMAYRKSRGIDVIPSYIDRSMVDSLISTYGSNLTKAASFFSKRLVRPSGSMIVLDFYLLREKFHEGAVQIETSPVVARTYVAEPPAPEPSGKVVFSQTSPVDIKKAVSFKLDAKINCEGNMTENGVYMPSGPTQTVEIPLEKAIAIINERLRSSFFKG